MTGAPAAPTPDIPVISGLSEIAGRYDAIFCDVWGVLIDGRRCFPEAAEALRRFRATGRYVTLITNASRPDAEVRRQLLDLGLPSDCFDDLVSAGELTLREIVARAGQACHHLGPPRDNGLFDEAGRRLGAPVRLASPEAADYVVCTGLLDERCEKPEDYDPSLTAMAARGLDMLCANPDIVVGHGDELVYCAGALAERYARLGGNVLMYGKPHSPIYAAARDRLTKPGAAGEEEPRILAIGDGARTDLAGAGRAGLDCLFIVEGVHGGDLLTPQGTIDAAGLASLAHDAGVRPVAAMRRLFW